jgi:hypothetical protein
MHYRLSRIGTLGSDPIKILFNCFLMHGAVVVVDGSIYMFTAPSGTGKSTHVALWKKYFKNVEIINGDKPFSRVDESSVWVYGIPWPVKKAGRRMWQFR